MISSKSSESSKKYVCEECDYHTSRLSQYNRHLATAKHQMIINGNANDNIETTKIAKSYICDCGKKYNYASGLSRHKTICNFKQDNSPTVDTANHAPREAHSVDSNEDLKQMVIACMQNQGFLQTIVTTLAENQTNQQENQKNQQENQKNQQEFQNKFLEVLPTLGTTNIQNQNNTFNLTNYLTIDCKDAETFNETKLRLKDYILGLDTNAFIEHAANSSSNAIMEKVIRGFYSNIEPCKRSIQTVDVARGKSYVKHDENGFVLDEEGNAVSKIACAAAHHSVNHCLRYKNTMKNPDNTWKSDNIESDYENVDNNVNNMWRFTDANTTMAKKVVGTATKIDKMKV
jgi:hypothetical protein